LRVKNPLKKSYKYLKTTTKPRNDDSKKLFCQYERVNNIIYKGNIVNGLTEICLFVSQEIKRNASKW